MLVLDVLSTQETKNYAMFSNKSLRDVMMQIRCHGQDSISAHDAQSPIAMSEFQSNSPFPPSNFNPRPPLVQYRFHSVFPTMSPQESRILWCLVKGDPIPYFVRDIPIGANVTQLKELLPEKIDILDGVNPRHLNLWKVVSLIPRACAF